MSAIFKINGEIATLTIEYTASETRIRNTLNDAVHELYSRKFAVPHDQGGELLPWEMLNNAHKLEMLDKYLRLTIIGLAKGYYVDDQKRQAQETALSDADVRFMGDDNDETISEIQVEK